MVETEKKMEMNSHTPGPWWFAADAPNTYAVGHGDLELCGGLRRHNARLIAAAPDLLDALQMAKAWVAQYHNKPGHDAASRCMSAVIDAAIAKATGDEK